MGNKLLASAPSLEELKKAISKFYGGSEIELIENGKNSWAISTGKGPIEEVIAKKKGKRYRFEMEGGPKANSTCNHPGFDASIEKWECPKCGFKMPF